MNRIVLIVCITMLLTACATQYVIATPYNVQALGVTPNHDASIASDISNGGVVTGVVVSAEDISSFLWSHSSGIAPPAGTYFDYTIGINNSNQTAGVNRIYDDTGKLLSSTPYIRNADGSTQNLASVTGVQDVLLKGIDDSGRVVVRYQNFNSYSGGYALVNKNGLTSIEVPDGDAVLNAISSSCSMILNDKYLWTTSGVSTLPWLAAATDVNVTCINDLGWVAGILDGHAVRWDNIGNFTDLGIGNVSGINNLGQVVGSVNDQAVIWGTNGSVTYLPLLDGYSSACATAINDNGQIAGTAWYNGYTTDMAVLWQPVPEPSAFAVLACGLVGILTRTRKRRSS